MSALTMRARVTGNTGAFSRHAAQNAVYNETLLFLLQQPGSA